MTHEENQDLLDLIQQGLIDQIIEIAKQDLEKLHSECDLIRGNAFNAFRDILRYNDKQLANTGHKTRESAIIAAYKIAQQKIDKLHEEHLVKYPD